MMPNKEKRIQKGTVAVLIAAVFVLTVFSGLYVYHLSENLNSETYVYLQEIAEQSRDILKKQINEDIKTLQDLAIFISKSQNLRDPSVMETLKEVTKNHEFKRMGIVFPDGSAITTDDVVLNLKDRDYFEKAMQGESTLSETLEDKVGGETINVYAAPIYQNDKIAGVVIATHYNEKYRSILSVSTFNGNGYSYIVDSTGKTVALSDHPNSVKSLDIRSDETDIGMIYRENKTRVDMLEDMQEGKPGILVYSLSGVMKYMNYVPVGVNGWYLLSVVPASVASEKTNYVLINTLWVCFIVILIFGMLIAYILYMQNKSRKALYNLAFTDSLTGACNLNKFKNEMEQLVCRKKQCEYAVIRFDVDKFKFINNVYGYNTGSKLLCHIVHIFLEKLYEDEQIARLYNDEFAVLMRFHEREELIARLKDITNKISEFHDGIPNDYNLIISFGIHKLDDDKNFCEIADMIDKANMAHKLGKGHHSTNFHFYRDTLFDDMAKEKEIENDMKGALRNREFEVYLQPKFDLEKENIIGAEALTRWNHPEKGLLFPGEFIAVFEKNGFVADLDMFVFEEVCRLIHRWQENGIQPVPVSVNVSRHLLENVNFTERYKNILEQYHIPIEYIELELTETVVFENIGHLLEVLNRLKEIGFTLSMDDFGSGYSSLNLLKDIPVDILKLDRGFFNQIMDNERGKKIVNGIVRLAKSIGIKVLSEGVETREQAEFLRQVGCDMAQGYLFAKPMPIKQFESMLRGEA